MADDPKGLIPIYRAELVRLYGALIAERSRLAYNRGWYLIQVAKRYEDDSVGIVSEMSPRRIRAAELQTMIDTLKGRPSMPRWSKIVYLGDLWEGVRTQKITIPSVADTTARRLRATYPRLAELAEVETVDTIHWAELQEGVMALEELGRQEPMLVSNDDLEKIMDRVWTWADEGNRLWIDVLNGPGTARGRI